jgi:hypothetical protein
VGTREQLIDKLFIMMGKISNPQCRTFFIVETNPAKKGKGSEKRYLGIFKKL